MSFQSLAFLCIQRDENSWDYSRSAMHVDIPFPYFKTSKWALFLLLGFYTTQEQSCPLKVPGGSHFPITVISRYAWDFEFSTFVWKSSSCCHFTPYGSSQYQARKTSLFQKIKSTDAFLKKERKERKKKKKATVKQAVLLLCALWRLWSVQGRFHTYSFFCSDHVFTVSNLIFFPNILDITSHVFKLYLKAC